MLWIPQKLNYLSLYIAPYALSKSKSDPVANIAAAFTITSNTFVESPAEIYLQNDITGKRQILSLFIERIELESLKKSGCRKPEKRVKVVWNDIISQ